MYKILLINLMLGLLGFLFYSLWDSRQHFNKPDGWIFKKFVSDNLQQWIFNTILITILVLVLMFDNEKSIKKLAELVGLELSNESLNGGFFIIGFLLTPLTKRTLK